MTVATISAQPAERHGWHALLWVAPITALWFALSYWQPWIQQSGMPTAASRIFIDLLIALGLWLGLERTDMTALQRRNVWLAVMIPLTLWVALIWSLAINGLFKPGAFFPPLVPLAIFVPMIVGSVLLLRSKRIAQVLDAMPATWLVALQVYRVFGMSFIVGWLYNRVPGVFALPAGIGDMATGLMAVPTAIWLASGSAESRKAAVAWNIFGLLDFTLALGLGLTTSPGPLQLIVPSIPNTTAGVYPTVLIPALAVPSSILLHAVSLRQLRRRSKAG